MLLDPFHILSPAPKKKTEDLPDPRIKLADIPINPRLRKIREHMLNMPIDLPDYYDTDLRPEKPWILYEYRFNAAGHVYNPIGVFSTEREALKAGSDFLYHAEQFAYNYHAKYAGTDFIQGLTYACYVFEHPLDIMGFSFAVEQYS